jgi:hypothetical protein
MHTTDPGDVYAKIGLPLVLTHDEARSGIVTLALSLAPRLDPTARRDLLAEVSAALTPAEQVAEHEIDHVAEPTHAARES